MKLWQKIAALLLAVMLPIMSISMFFLVGIQAKSMRQIDEENTRYALTACRTSVSSAVKQHIGFVQDTTQRSVVQYFFSEYAGIVRNENTYFSLTSDGNYLFNNSPYDPKAVLPSDRLCGISDEPYSIITQRLTAKNGEQVWIGGCCFSAGSQEYTVYISMNVSQTEKRIAQMYGISICMILLSCFLTALISILLLRYITKPITKLTQTADSIAKGEYHLRSKYVSGDEVGTLSMAFDQMAEAVEEKIHALDTENERKQFLLGALSHELRTPMTSIIGYGESLLHMPLTEEQKRACAYRIIDSGRRAEQLSQKMMELVSLSVEQEINKTVFDTEHLLEAVKDIFGEKVVVSCDVKEIFGDETLLCSLISNLVQNALCASDKGKTVNVSVQLLEPSSIRISVQDRGCGIPDSHITRLTDPFYRVDKARSRKAGGAGLGLSICKLIAEKHGGTLHIESEVGVGTTISVIIPMHTV
ncbi:MAG: HAMP domain-containing histidine kinase [Ruminococcaceae bacterium]|nr:HAMP domain-containing histidine kinase [Oscillospiraceae bacterium]